MAVVALATAFLALAAPAQARWLKAETGKFIVYSNGDETVLRQYVSDLEAFDSLLRAQHNLPLDGLPPRKLPLYLVRDKSELDRSWGYKSQGVGGYYTASNADIFAVAIRDRGEDNTIKHEYVHHFMWQYFAGAYPTWMVEGYAEYFATAKIEPKYLEVGYFNEGRAMNLVQFGWVPMADVLGKRLADIKPDDRPMFYAQAWLLTHWLMSDPTRYKAFQAYLASVSTGGDPVKSMQAATGMDPATLERTLKTYLRGGLKYIRYSREAFKAPDIVMTTLPPSADDLLLESLQLGDRAPDDQEGALLATIRQRAAKYPAEATAQRVLGQAELELGDKEKGRSLLTALIKADPSDATARYVLGDYLLDTAYHEAKQDKGEALGGEALGYLTEAYRLNPKDYRIVAAYARSQAYADKPGPESQLTLLVAAYKLAPQVSGLRLQLIQLLIEGKHWPQASALLKPLANNPHGGDGADQAREMLKKVQAEMAAAG